MTSATVMDTERGKEDAEVFAESLARVNRETVPEETIPDGIAASSAAGHTQQIPYPSEPLCESFHAETSLGRVALGIWAGDARAVHDVAANGSSCLHAALCLGRAEPLICLLEDWLGVPLDLEPGTLTLPQDNYLRVEWAPPDAADAAAIAEKVLMYLPLDALAHLSVPPAELAAALRWNALPCTVVISSAAVLHRQLERLEPGGLMLMPASFEPFWRCQVRLGACPALTFAAELDAGQQRLIFEPYESKTVNSPGMRVEDDVVPANAERVDVVLRHDLVIAVDRLTGWADHPLFELERTLAEFAVEIKSSQGVLAQGDLMPVGNGYGVFVRSVTSVSDGHTGHDMFNANNT